MKDFSEEEISRALGSTKNGKAAGIDNILPEFIKRLGTAG